MNKNLIKGQFASNYISLSTTTGISTSETIWELIETTYDLTFAYMKMGLNRYIIGAYDIST
jgi:hypothetical protein